MTDAPSQYETGLCSFTVKWRVTTYTSGTELRGPERHFGDYPAERDARQALADCGFTNGKFGWRRGPTDATIQKVVEYGEAVDLSPAAKPLEWENTVGDSWRSTAIGLRYYAFKTEDGSWTAYTEGYQFWSKLECRTLEEAQEAAQAEHNRRILSALTTRHTVEEAEAVRWIKLIRDQEQGCGGRLSPIEVVAAMKRTCDEALIALAGEQGQ